MLFNNDNIVATNKLNNGCRLTCLQFMNHVVAKKINKTFRVNLSQLRQYVILTFNFIPNEKHNCKSIYFYDLEFISTYFYDLDLRADFFHA